MSLIKAKWLALYGIEVLVYFRLFTLSCPIVGVSRSNSICTLPRKYDFLGSFTYVWELVYNALLLNET